MIRAILHWLGWRPSTWAADRHAPTQTLGYVPATWCDEWHRKAGR